MYEDDLKKTKLTGVVIKSNLAGMSKSAHISFVLQQKGKSVKLRREGASPFYDAFFEKFENKNVTVTGFDMEQYFLVMALKEIVAKK